MESDEGLYRSLIIILLIGIIVTLGLNLFMRQKVLSQEGFTELFFSDHQSLPKLLKAGRNHSVDLSFSNQHDMNKSFVFEFESQDRVFQESFNLTSGGTLNLSLKLYDLNQTWGLLSETTSSKSEGRDLDSTDFELISVSLPHLGEVLHLNLSVEGLRVKPYSYSSYNSKKVEYMRSYKPWNGSFSLVSNQSNVSFFRQENGSIVFDENLSLNITSQQTPEDVYFDLIEENNTNRFWVKGERLYYSETHTQREYRIVDKPFVVKVWERGAKKDEVLSVHFWAKII